MTYCAIFDLDETLILKKSMFEVIKEYYLLNSSDEATANHQFNTWQSKVQAYALTHTDRTQSNRYYYQLMAGLSISKVLDASRSWFIKNKNSLFNPPILRAFKDHKAHGAEIIIVTGSFFECVAPIVNHLNVSHLICAHLEIVNDRYTGIMLSEPTIGKGKASSLLKYIDQHQFSLINSYAYGDHDSDIPLLSLATHPVAVGNNTKLLQHAKKYAWSIIEENVMPAN